MVNALQQSGASVTPHMQQQDARRGAMLQQHRVGQDSSCSTWQNRSGAESTTQTPARQPPKQQYVAAACHGSSVARQLLLLLMLLAALGPRGE